MFTTPEIDGQGLLEYALIISLVTIVVVIILALLGPAKREGDP